jgi:hypothetical protein
MRIDAYRNLNKARRDRSRFVWSLRLDGKVAGHHEAIHLVDVSLRVSEGGLRRIGESGTRNVYAYLRGESYDLPATTPFPSELLEYGWRGLTLNPFKEGVFVWADDRTPAPLHLAEVLLTEHGAFAWDDSDN